MSKYTSEIITLYIFQENQKTVTYTTEINLFGGSFQNLYSILADTHKETCPGVIAKNQFGNQNMIGLCLLLNMAQKQTQSLKGIVLYEHVSGFTVPYGNQELIDAFVDAVELLGMPFDNGQEE